MLSTLLNQRHYKKICIHLLIITWLFTWYKLFCLDQIEALIANAKVQNPEESPAKIWNIQQIIMAINALSKVLIAFNLLYFLYFPIIDWFLILMFNFKFSPYASGSFRYWNLLLMDNYLNLIQYYIWLVLYLFFFCT